MFYKIQGHQKLSYSKPPTDTGHFHNQKSNNGDMVDKAKHVSERHLSSYIKVELLKTIKYTFKHIFRS